jgi:hypothetical protein
MKERSVGIALVLGFAFGLAGCGDTGPTVPDGLEPQFAKEKPCDPWPSCRDEDGGDPGATGNVTFAGGMVGGPDLKDISHDRVDFLDFRGPDNVLTTMTDVLGNYSNPASYPDFSSCEVYTKNYDLWTGDLLYELAREFDMVGQVLPANSWMGSRVVVDVGALGQPSETNLISLNYVSANGDIGLTNLRIGGEMRFNIGATTVTGGETDPGVRAYTFTGGTVRVQSRAYKIKDRAAIECPLIGTVTVTLDQSPPPA